MSGHNPGYNPWRRQKGQRDARGFVFAETLMLSALAASAEARAQSAAPCTHPHWCMILAAAGGY